MQGLYILKRRKEKVVSWDVDQYKINIASTMKLESVHNEKFQYSL